METEKPLVAGTITQDACVIMVEQEAPRFESTNPSRYRLARKRNGEVVLQGSFHWQQGLSTSGFEWRDIPTVDVDD